jgi:murein DD-endopeptidase MepM/ murein hydrolase activator NlpD
VIVATDTEVFEVAKAQYDPTTWGVLVNGGYRVRIRKADAVIESARKSDQTGLDFVTSPGDTVSAVAAGLVVLAGARSESALTIEINHGKGLSTRHAQLKNLSVKQGDKVSKGQANSYNDLSATH